MRHRVLLALLVLAALAGCHYSPVQVASSLTPVNSIRKYEVLPRVTGESCTFKLLYLIPFGEDDRINEALHDAVPLGLDYDDLIAVTLEEKTTIYVIGAEHCVIVSGYPIRYADTQGKGGIFSHEKNPRVAAPAPAPAAAPAPAPAPTYVTPTYAAPAPAPAPTYAAPAPAPAPVAAPVVSAPKTTARTTPPPPPPPPPAPAPVPAPQPTVSSPVVAAGDSPFKSGPDGQQVLDCGVLCKNYTAPLRNQSTVVQGIIFQKCVDKCNAGNMAFIECALDARSTPDVTRCNSL